jgi:hypothetical protein
MEVAMIAKRLRLTAIVTDCLDQEPKVSDQEYLEATLTEWSEGSRSVARVD